MRKFSARWWVTPQLRQWRAAQTDIPLWAYFLTDGWMWRYGG